MKPVRFIPACLVILASCQGNQEQEPTPAPALAPVVPVVEWTGLYADTLPCADCPGILTQLDLRADSTYVLRERYLERDSIPYGTIGKWSVKGDVVTLATFHKPMEWRMESDGLHRLDADGKPIDSPLNYTIRKVAHIDPLPMHLTGGYVYFADSHSFTPCGAGFALPVAMDPAGSPGAGPEMEKTYAKQVKEPPQPLYVQVTASMREGPAMEGSGTEDYLHIDRLEGVLDLQACR
ncbi:MAG: copper resistance protein NlpE N-terminal domain-containing protein [Flavobacteriia bacterium]|nr:copper resistance protein NlpE N-terminal domain-containing protein [Flavobacteriia bacterium]